MRFLKVGFRAPMTKPGTLELNSNIVGLRNGGTATVQINLGQWALSPGETLHFGSQTDVNLVKQEIEISFDTSTGANQLLQILEIKITDC